MEVLRMMANGKSVFNLPEHSHNNMYMCMEYVYIYEWDSTTRGAPFGWEMQILSGFSFIALVLPLQLRYSE